MSFIRCLNNPEGLYVYDHVDGCISVSWRGHDPVELPRRDFYGLCRQVAWRETGQYGSLEARGVAVDRSSGAVLSAQEEKQYHKNYDDLLHGMHPQYSRENQPGFDEYVNACRKLTAEQREENLRLAQESERWIVSYKIGLYYNGKLVLAMWGVTWAYVVMNVTQGSRWDWLKPKRRRAKR